jgi:hypothetical protein
MRIHSVFLQLQLVLVSAFVGDLQDHSAAMVLKSENQG